MIVLFKYEISGKVPQEKNTKKKVDYIVWGFFYSSLAGSKQGVLDVAIYFLARTPPTTRKHSLNLLNEKKRNVKHFKKSHKGLEHRDLNDKNDGCKTAWKKREALQTEEMVEKQEKDGEWCRHKYKMKASQALEASASRKQFAQRTKKERGVCSCGFLESQCKLEGYG